MSETTDDTETPEVACTLTEAEAAERAGEIREQLVPHFEGAEDLEDGYRLVFEGSADVLEAVARWIGKEAVCCSFADFHIEYERPYDEVGLRFTGPEGTRALLDEGFAEVFDEVASPS